MIRTFEDNPLKAIDMMRKMSQTSAGRALLQKMAIVTGNVAVMTKTLEDPVAATKALQTLTTVTNYLFTFSQGAP